MFRMSENPFLGHEHRRPEVGATEAARMLEAAFGIRGRLTELGSHQDRNYLVATDGGGRFVLKVARQGTGRAELEAENAAILHAAAAALPFELPIPQPALDGALITAATTAGGTVHDLRLVTWIDGEPMDTVAYLAPAVLRAHGEMAARIAIALEGFDHPGLDRVLQWDIRHAGAVVDALAHFSTTPARRVLAQAEMARAAEALVRLEPDLRIRTIHADVTDLNTVARRDTAGRPIPAGLIDFGDLSRTWLAAELAVTIAADAFHDLARPLQVARDVARGFLPLLPLRDAELAAVWPMVVARSAAVAISGDQQATLESDNAYVHQTRDEEWAALEAVAAVPFALATAVLRQAAGLAPAVLSPARLAAAPVFEPVADPWAIDLSTTSDALPGAAIGDPGSAAGLITRAGAVGRWGEARLVDTVLDAAGEAPTIHLGIDLFAAPGTPVHAPVGGAVTPGDVGLVIGAGLVDLRLDGVDPTAGTSGQGGRGGRRRRPRRGHRTGRPSAPRPCPAGCRSRPGRPAFGRAVPRGRVAGALPGPIGHPRSAAGPCRRAR